MKITAFILFAATLLGAALIIVGKKSTELDNSALYIKLGIATIAVPYVIYLFFCLYKSISYKSSFHSEDFSLLSSSLTLVPKLFLPFYFFAAWVAASVLSYFSKYSNDIFLPVSIFLLLITLLSLIVSIKVKYAVMEKAGNYTIFDNETDKAFISKSEVIKHYNFKFFSIIKTYGKNYFYLNSLR